MTLFRAGETSEQPEENQWCPQTPTSRTHQSISGGERPGPHGWGWGWGGGSTGRRHEA